MSEKTQGTLIEGVLKGGTEFIKAGMTPDPTESQMALLNRRIEADTINAIPGYKGGQLLPSGVTQGDPTVGIYGNRVGKDATKVTNAASLQYPMNTYRPAVAGGVA
jgi:hypothetical protein